MGFVENTLAFVFVLGVMILVHELGHFLAARYFDVRVDAFSIGFGPRLFGLRRGETDYKVCLLPVGGYVKMAGMEGEKPSEPSGDPREFAAKPRWQRFIIVLMGPVFNVILAVLLPIGLYMVRYERPAYLVQPAVIGFVAEGSPAAEAGIQEGDTIVAIDGQPTPDWEAVKLTEVAAVHKTVDVTVKRDGRTVQIPVAIGASESTAFGQAGWSEAAPVRLGPTMPGMPADKAGIQDGDILVSIAGRKVNVVEQVPELIQKAGGNPVELELLRDGRRVKVELTPVFNKSKSEGDAWRIGVNLVAQHEWIRTRLGFIEATRESLDQNRKNATLIFKFLAGLVEQRMSPKSIEGPIGIARLSGQAARSGFHDLILLMAAISLNLGIFNLLPIPILDGGVITLLLLESALQRDISIAVKERIVQVGLVFLMLLFAFVMYNDILKSFPQS